MAGAIVAEASVINALFDAYGALIAVRPEIASPKYTEWQRVVRNIEDALHIDPTERYTKQQEI